MTLLAIVGYVLILVIIAWTIISTMFAGTMAYGHNYSKLVNAMAAFGIIIIGIIGISAVYSLMIKR